MINKLTALIVLQIVHQGTEGQRVIQQILEGHKYEAMRFVPINLNYYNLVVLK